VAQVLGIVISEFTCERANENEGSWQQQPASCIQKSARKIQMPARLLACLQHSPDLDKRGRNQVVDELSVLACQVARQLRPATILNTCETWSPHGRFHPKSQPEACEHAMEECHDSRAPLLDDAVGSCKRDATATMRTGASENRIEKCDVRCQSVKRQKSTGRKTWKRGAEVRQGKAGIRKREHSRLQVSSEIASGFAAVLS
jgi:hypothetical protein